MQNNALTISVFEVVSCFSGVWICVQKIFVYTIKGQYKLAQTTEYSPSPVKCLHSVQREKIVLLGRFVWPLIERLGIYSSYDEYLDSGEEW